VEEIKHTSIFDIRYSIFGSKGFTLIELIIFIIIAGIFLPATYVAFSASMQQATTPEDYTRGMLLAEETMELAAKRFSVNFVSNPSQVSTDVTSGLSCATLGVTVPTGYGCTCTPTWIASLTGGDQPWVLKCAKRYRCNPSTCHSDATPPHVIPSPVLWGVGRLSLRATPGERGNPSP